MESERTRLAPEPERFGIIYNLFLLILIPFLLKLFQPKRVGKIVSLDSSLAELLENFSDGQSSMETRKRHFILFMTFQSIIAFGSRIALEKS